ncbi:glycosyltransferase [Pedobacter frigiditerrae]|uniref:glycosyltransferase n=1 Tax=Pedobacter frigiditerrae TaxID=2530452 RepID=UPI002930C274|nr:glycosyltransferase [Pedobacter frigiditerrae]
MIKIVIVTSGQPSLNPRLVKEADALSDQGFIVTVIYQYWNDWGTVIDLKLLKSKKWTAVHTGGNPDNKKFQYLISRIKHRIGNLLARYIGMKYGIAEFAIKRNVNGLLDKAKSIKADLYIAHNLGALPVAVLASKKHYSKCGFDAEDFHRQEQTDNENSLAFRLAQFIEDKYLPSVDYLTVASPLIGKEYKKFYPKLNPIIINNVFPAFCIQEKKLRAEGEKLKLFWFSQTIGKERGIEDVIKAVALLKRKHISLTLLGNIDEANKTYFLSLADDFRLEQEQLKFISPISPDKIFELANKHDIGLAIESGFCLNNDIALSNKIFTYLTSGLAVIASETSAQKEFLNKYTTIGFSYSIGNVEALATLINNFDINRELLQQTKFASYSLARESMNWELESKKFISLIEKTLKD